MHEVTISNTTPIFYLHRVGQLDLLRKLYNEIIVPKAVIEELDEGKKQGEDIPEIKSHQWIKVREIQVPSHIKLIPDLGKGESEVLSLGLDEKQLLLIIDDKLARQIAKLQNLKFTGTAGVLLKSKAKGYINKIKPIMDHLKESGFFLRQELFDDVLEQAGELKS